ncbi:MAG: hypothetical protein P1V35_06170 [Planctomycetota bacterium]|nr:hypothetical protein [Planctomycetota bacterium]
MFFSAQNNESLRQVRTDLVRIENKLDLLLKQAGLTYDPYEALSQSVAAALKSGRKIEAIKQYRAETGAGLREAKDFIDSVAD